MGGLLLLLIAALVALAVLAPLLHLLFRVSTGDGEASLAVLWRPRTLELLANSLIVTVGVSACALVLGVAQAWVLVCARLPARWFWTVLACLPLAIPSFVAAFAYSTLIPGARGIPILMLVLVLSTTPYVTVPAVAAFARADTQLADVARTLGRGPVRAFFAVTLPQVMPAALAGALLVALYALSDFGAPALLRVDTLTTGVYAQFRSSFDRVAPAAMSLPLVVLALACVIAESRLRGRHRLARDASRPVSPARVRLTPPVRWAAMTGLSLVAVAGLVAPLAALLARVPNAGRYASELEEVLSGSATTLAVGALAAVVTVAAALPISILAARRRTRVVAALDAASYAGHAIPGLIVALAIVALASGFLPRMYQTAALLIGAYVIMFLPKAIGSSRAAIERVPPLLEDVSATLGVRPLMTWLRVTLTGAAPGILAAAVLVATAVMKELPATLMLHPIGMDTLATQLWSKTSIGAYGAAAVPALLLVLVGVFPALFMAHAVRTPVKADS